MQVLTVDERGLFCKMMYARTDMAKGERKGAVLTFKRIKSHLPFAGIIRSSPYSPRFQDNG